MKKRNKKILTLFGTRPEIIKLAPIIREMEEREEGFQTVNVTSAQHTDLLYPFVRLFGIRLDHDLHVMVPKQTPNQVCARVLSLLEPILEKEQPDLILIQGDTTTALAGALAGFHLHIPVGHVEAGLRSGNPLSPFPEEMNRRLITQLATYHFVATARNRGTLLAEGVSAQRTFLTGNPVVDSLKMMLEKCSVSSTVACLLKRTLGLKRIVLTTHRRESFGEAMAENLKVLRSFVERHEDTALLFPVHPNPIVVDLARTLLGGCPRIHLIEPMNYDEFIVLLSHSWLIVSDSGGIQEEAPSLGKPLLILRENTERPEAVESSVARLVGGCAKRLGTMLEEVIEDGVWAKEISKTENPFGRGDSGRRIVDIISRVLRGDNDALQV
ncbi:MAG TPA: UDP-N-acetylglucosamine 2-epimerase (non-hydrolyzing) [Candidatus Binatia bacterium]|jgi:UDP-N-acetylglucosamine 2-epimerase (non-hydrolysing)|nr:UDP-N-acetylglucosamine 2-epimerase (non-hydrolyzing) [Candidatus Binatia bacterium]